MQLFDPTRERYVYRLAILSADLGHVLGRQRDADVLLPRVSIPGCVRPAAAIQKVVRDRWNLKIVILDFLYRSDGLPGCVVAQMLLLRGIEGWIPVALDQLSAAELTGLERATIAAISNGNPGDRGVFSRACWVHEAMAWIQQEVGAKVQLTGEVEQHNASGTFALVRFGTENEPAYWLKATGDPNRREFEITAALAVICPEYLPPVVAKRHDWNAWLMEEAGKRLEPEVNGARMTEIVLSMARLQILTAGSTEQLLAAGVTDQRMPVLRRHVGEIVSYLEEAMEQQISRNAPRVAASRLREISNVLEDACGAMEELDIPSTVIHNDIDRGNILVRSDTCVFTDWSEASIGNPVLTLQRLLMMLPDSNIDRGDFKQIYGECWSDRVPESRMDVAFALMPLLAPLSYLFGRGDWLRSAADRSNPHIQRWARSIGRHIDRAAQSTSLLETLHDRVRESTPCQARSFSCSFPPMHRSAL